VSDFEPSQSHSPDATATARMAALKRYNILDTDRDAVFDGIAEIAATLLDAPIAVVNFIADDRQWFKAEIGIGQRELPLDVSICRVALPERGIFVVPDLAHDDRFSCHPLVTVAAGLRFYAGTVLESGGVPIGTVCVLDTKPRAGGISDKQRRGLEALAVQAMAALERSATAGRDRYRLALTERLRDAVNAQAMMEIATETLGEYLGVAQVGFAEVEDDQAHVQVHRDWNDGRIASVVGRWHIDDFGPDFIRDIKAGQTIAIDDVELDARTNSAEALANFAKIGTRALLNIGLIRDDQMRALLFTHHHEPRSWTLEDIEIVHETVERLWAAVERARADERLTQSEAVARARADQIEALFSAAPVGLAVLDRDLRYINVNERLAEMNGVASADHIGRTLREVVPDLDAQAVEALDQVLAGQELLGIEFVGMTPAQPGVVRTWRSNWVPMRDASGEICGATLSGEEITDEKAIQQALKASETRLTQAQTLGGIGSWEWDHDTGEGIVSSSYRVLHELGGTSARITSADLLDIMHPDDRAAFGEAVRNGLATGERITVEYRITRASGVVRTIRGTGQRIGASGSARTAGIVEDITERRAAHQRLALLADTASRLLVANDPARMVDELFALIASALKLDIFMKCRLDEAGELTLVAQSGLTGDAASAVKSLRGETVDRRVARERAAIMAVDVQASSDPAYDFIRAQGVDHYACYPLKVGHRLRGTLGYGRRSGQSFEEGDRAFLQTVSHYVAIALERVSDEAEMQALNAGLETQVKARTSELVASNRKLQAEIKRREASQAALIQGQKLDALGQLTAGIAHDFNNILAAIAGGMDLIERRVEDEKVKYITGHCKDAAFRGASLVKQMLAFARQEVLAPRSSKLARLADEIAPLIRQAIPGNIVSIDFPADLPPVLIDPVLLETALLNLAVNARDAMPGGGTLSLAASISRPGDRNHPAELKSVEAIAIAVRDTGEGMPPAIVQRVTEPFFTTKAPGKGTGLGLAMVYGFIGQSGGAMHIDSRVGEGTTITLYLPLATAAGEAEAAATAVADAAVPTGVGAVLLVDDDAAVRAVSAEQLRDLGYRITEADGYAAAMTRIEGGDSFDCVVTDVVMPGGDGVALAVAIRSTRPDLPILFMTGRADGKRVAGERVVHKPFKLIELATAVAEVIELMPRERATVAKIASRSRSQCVADMLDHWSAGKFAGKVPEFAAFDADTCSEPHKLAVVMADASQLPMRFTVVSAGKELEDLLGRPMNDNEFEVRGADGFGSAEESYRRAVKTRQPVFDYMKMDFGDGGPERFERLILPYSSDGGLVDRLVSVVVFADDAKIPGG
jgi:PAS domain S-box-containing protein